MSFMLLAFGLAGCGAASDTIDGVTDAKTASLHGTWRSEDGVEHPASLELVQRDLSVTLIMKLDGHSCLATSELEISRARAGARAGLIGTSTMALEHALQLT